MNEPRVDDAGIGAAARMGIQVYDQASRNSGRTHRMIMALAPNTVILTLGNDRHVRMMVRDLRGPDFPFELHACDCMRHVYEHYLVAKTKKRPIALDHHLIQEIYLQEIKAATKRLADLGIAEHNHSVVTDRPPPAAMFMEGGHGRRS